MRLGVANWGDRVSPVLDTAASLTVIALSPGGEAVRQVLPLAAAGLQGRSRQLLDLDLEVLICGAVSRPLLALLSAGGLEVLPFVSGEVSTVLEAFDQGQLPDQSLTLPGCRCQWRGRVCAGPGCTRPQRRCQAEPVAAPEPSGPAARCPPVEPSQEDS